MQLCLRQPPPQVGRELEVEHGIALAPGEQDGNVELGQTGGHVGERGVRRMRGRRRDIADEVGDRGATLGRAVRSEVGGTNRTWNPPRDGDERPADEHRRPATGEITECA